MTSTDAQKNVVAKADDDDVTPENAVYKGHKRTPGEESNIHPQVLYLLQYYLEIESQFSCRLVS